MNYLGFVEISISEALGCASLWKQDETNFQVWTQAETGYEAKMSAHFRNGHMGIWVQILILWLKSKDQLMRDRPLTLGLKTLAQRNRGKGIDEDPESKQ